MAPITLSIVLDEGAVTRKIKFDSGLSVQKVYEIVKDKVNVPPGRDEYALFLRSADDNLSGVWLEAGRTLDYYMLVDGDSLDYICKIQNLKVRMLDGTLKTLKVDQTRCVGDLMMDICGRLGITNHDEYGLCYEQVQEEQVPAIKTGTLTLKRNKQPKERDAAMKDMSTKLNTDDNVEWLDQRCTLRQLGVEPNTTLLLKRRLFFSDCNVNTRDPVQLNLLYVQTRDAILTGRHLVTEAQAADCKVRWINIRDVHRRILRKNLSQPSRPSKMYKYENEMAFMRAFYKDVHNVSSLLCEDGDATEERNEEWGGIYEEEHDVPEGSCSDDSDKPIKKVVVKRRKPKKKRKISNYAVDEEEEQASSSFIKQEMHEVATPSEFDSTDPVDSFLLSIGATLKTFSPYHLNVAKTKIFAIVQEHDLQQIVEKDRQDSNDVKIFD